jgi:tetraacyldisaccharide 4'-kinase
VCVGNLTVGGSGKTPLAIAIAGLLSDLNTTPWFLSRGYGGRLIGPHVVDPSRDRALDVGDEPRLLAAHAPVVVARDRIAGAKLIEQLAPANAVIVMDDGLQNSALVKDLTLCVVDQRRGVGNGRVFPAGPLRARVAEQIKRIDAMVVVRPPSGRETAAGQDGIEHVLRHAFPGPVLMAETKPVGDFEWLTLRPVIAYAGIANPDRFFDLVTALGGALQSRHAFPDHHPFSDAEAEDLVGAAAAANAQLVTTSKDAARLSGESGHRGRLHAQSRIIPIMTDLANRERERLASLLRGVLARR